MIKVYVHVACKSTSVTNDKNSKSESVCVCVWLAQQQRVK